MTPQNQIANMQMLLHNRQQFPPEDLAKYAGKYVAWSPDGTRILADNEDLLRLDAKLKNAGHNPAEILVSSIPADEVILGGGGHQGKLISACPIIGWSLIPSSVQPYDSPECRPTQGETYGHFQRGVNQEALSQAVGFACPWADATFVGGHHRHGHLWCDR